MLRLLHATFTLASDDAIRKGDPHSLDIKTVR
jgi:hypothetical protein